MDIRKIKKLIELLDESGIAEIEIREGEDSVRISRYGQSSGPAAAPAQVVATAGPESPESAVPKGNGAERAQAEPNGHTVTSPMVGTFYEGASPGTKPFVELGQRIKVGDTLCIIEAMKILNEIEAERAGVIAAVLAENGQPVEYGQPLFIVE